MSNSITNEACGKHVWVENLHILLWMMPYKPHGITMGSILPSYFLYIFTNWGLHKVAYYFPLRLKIHFSSDFFCAFQDWVKPISCPKKNLCLACVESMVLTVYGKNKICGNKVCNIQLFSLGDFMSINLKEIVELFTTCGRKKMMECFNNLKPNDTWT